MPKEKVEKKKAPKKTVRKQPKSVTIYSPASPETRIVVASELADDEIIEREMMGEVLPYFIYCFKQDGKDVIGLTVKGVNEVVRRLGKDPRSGSKIRINPQYLIKEECEREGEKGIEVSVFAEDLVTGNSAWGVKFEPYKKKGRNGQYNNTFAVEKALSKAERNAKRKLIAEPLAMKTIQKIMKLEPETVKHLEAPKTVARTVTPAKPQATTPEELEAMAMNAIKNAKTPEVAIRIAEGAMESDKLTDEAKKRIHSSATAKVDSFDA